MQRNNKVNVFSLCMQILGFTLSLKCMWVFLCNNFSTGEIYTNYLQRWTISFTRWAFVRRSTALFQIKLCMLQKPIIQRHASVHPGCVSCSDFMQKYQRANLFLQNEKKEPKRKRESRSKYSSTYKICDKMGWQQKDWCSLIGIYFVATLVNYVQRNIEWRKRVGRQRQCVCCVMLELWLMALATAFICDKYRKW